MRIKVKKSLTLMLCFVLLGVMALPALAETIDITKPVDLKVLYQDEEPLVGAVFTLHRVADMDESLHFSPTAAYAGYPVEMNGLDSDGWRTLALTLSAFIAQDNVAPDAMAAVDESGLAVFHQMDSGLYLLQSTAFVKDGMMYATEPTMIALPGKDEDGNWLSQVQVLPKYEKNPVGPISLQVVKIWDDEDAESFRPDTLVIQLLCDGKVYEEVLLSDYNNWRYTWENLDGSKQWQVVEKNVPDGYTVTMHQEGTVIAIRNYHAPGKPEPELPQTGLNWWPVVILAGSGMALFFIGWLKRRYHEE